MPRPVIYTEPRLHLGMRFDKYFVQLFDQVAKKHGLTRPQAVEFCLRHAVRTNTIPSYSAEVDAMIEAERLREKANRLSTLEPPYGGELSIPPARKKDPPKTA